MKPMSNCLAWSASFAPGAAVVAGEADVGVEAELAAAGLGAVDGQADASAVVRAVDGQVAEPGIGDGGAASAEIELDLGLGQRAGEVALAAHGAAERRRQGQHLAHQGQREIGELEVDARGRGDETLATAFEEMVEAGLEPGVAAQVGLAVDVDGELGVELAAGELRLDLDGGGRQVDLGPGRHGDAGVHLDLAGGFGHGHGDGGAGVEVALDARQAQPVIDVDALDGQLGATQGALVHCLPGGAVDQAGRQPGGRVELGGAARPGVEPAVDAEQALEHAEVDRDVEGGIQGREAEAGQGDLAAGAVAARADRDVGRDLAGEDAGQGLGRPGAQAGEVELGEVELERGERGLVDRLPGAGVGDVVRRAHAGLEAGRAHARAAGVELHGQGAVCERDADVDVGGGHPGRGGLGGRASDLFVGGGLAGDLGRGGDLALGRREGGRGGARGRRGGIDRDRGRGGLARVGREGEIRGVEGEVAIDALAVLIELRAQGHGADDRQRLSAGQALEHAADLGEADVLEADGAAGVVADDRGVDHGHAPGAGGEGDAARLHAGPVADAHVAAAAAPGDVGGGELVAIEIDGGGARALVHAARDEEGDEGVAARDAHGDVELARGLRRHGGLDVAVVILDLHDVGGGDAGAAVDELGHAAQVEVGGQGVDLDVAPAQLAAADLAADGQGVRRAGHAQVDLGLAADRELAGELGDRRGDLVQAGQDGAHVRTVDHGDLAAEDDGAVDGQGAGRDGEIRVDLGPLVDHLGAQREAADRLLLDLAAQGDLGGCFEGLERVAAGVDARLDVEHGARQVAHDRGQVDAAAVEVQGGRGLLGDDRAVELDRAAARGDHGGDPGGPAAVEPQGGQAELDVGREADLGREPVDELLGRAQEGQGRQAAPIPVVVGEGHDQEGVAEAEVDAVGRDRAVVEADGGVDGQLASAFLPVGGEVLEVDGGVAAAGGHAGLDVDLLDVGDGLAVGLGPGDGAVVDRDAIERDDPGRDLLVLGLGLDDVAEVERAVGADARGDVEALQDDLVHRDALLDELPEVGIEDQLVDAQGELALVVAHLDVVEGEAIEDAALEAADRDLAGQDLIERGHDPVANLGPAPVGVDDRHGQAEQHDDGGGGPRPGVEHPFCYPAAAHQNASPMLRWNATRSQTLRSRSSSRSS